MRLVPWVTRVLAALMVFLAVPSELFQIGVASASASPNSWDNLAPLNIDRFYLASANRGGWQDLCDRRIQRQQCR